MHQIAEQHALRLLSFEKLCHQPVKRETVLLARHCLVLHSRGIIFTASLDANELKLHFNNFTWLMKMLNNGLELCL